MYRLARPFLFAFDPETSHRFGLAAIKARRFLSHRPVTSPRLATRVAGLTFANPLGLAAGFDKDGIAIDGWFGLGLGAVEIGTLTPRPQPGNLRPRLFRLSEDRAVINRMGFNNCGLTGGLGHAAAAKAPGVLGINVGANKDAADRIADYVEGVRRAAPIGDHVTINISSPNTPGLRDLQHGAALVELLVATRAAAAATPLFLKVAPDLSTTQIDDIARAAIDHRLDALIVSNTTISRPELASAHAGETGGLSGAPLAALARQRLADFRAATGGAIPLIAAGGIGDAREAYARIRAGASLVQLYTAMIYEGPGLPRRLLRELDALLARDGFADVAEAVGAG